MEPFILALTAHGLAGGADVIVNHEAIARAAAQPNTGPEQLLHSARELIFALLFLGLAWFAWHGGAAFIIAALLLTELAVSTIDTVIEPDVRVLPVTERVAHMLLFVNAGIILGMLGPVLLAWGKLPTQLAAADYGAASWVLSALALLALCWSMRDATSATRRSLHQNA